MLFLLFVTEFPDIIMRVCTFHLTQAVFQKATTLGLKPAYQEDFKTLTCRPTEVPRAALVMSPGHQVKIKIYILK
jgi:hypothetical protein